MYCFKRVFPTIAFILILVSYPLAAPKQAVKIWMKAGQAKVTLLKGRALLFKKGMMKSTVLSKGNFIAQGDRVTTEVKSRIEIQMPDNSFVRFDENTTFVIESADYDPNMKKRNININMILGKTWASVPKFSGTKGRFEMTTKTSVAGVRGTDFRMNVNEDNSAVLKVYEGEVGVSKRKDVESEKTEAGKLTEPHPIAGPQPVAGPHPVSMDEWTYIVSSLQQINIQPDGTVTKPFRFDIAKDLNEWVQWNQERNRLLHLSN